MKAKPASTHRAPSFPRFLRRGWEGISARFPVLLLALAPVALAAQDSVATIRVDVKLVSIFVNVTDKNGALVGGLTKDDFAIYEDGRPQQIAVFEKQSELPLNLTLAIDTSGSVHKDMSEEAAAAKLEGGQG